MNQPKKVNLQEIKIESKSDRLIVWNSNRFNFEKWRSEKRRCQFWNNLLYQLEAKEYSPQTKRLWIYVNEPENKLKYIFEFKKTSLRPGQIPTNPECNMDDCCEEVRKFNKREKIKDKICEFAYELTKEPIHEFKKGNSLVELQSYKHKDWPKRKQLFKPKPTRSFVYVSSYPELVKDITTGKIS